MTKDWDKLIRQEAREQKAHQLIREVVEAENITRDQAASLDRSLGLLGIGARYSSNLMNCVNSAVDEEFEKL